MRSPFWHETAKGRIYTVVTKRQKSHHFRSLLKGNHASECMHGPSFIRFRILKVTEIAIIYGKLEVCKAGVGVAAAFFLKMRQGNI